MAKVIDSFIFNDELDLLSFRLHQLDEVVDFFIIVEATTTFSNQPKILHFKENKSRFAAFECKIIHIIVDDMPGGSDPWPREYHQRHSITRGLDQLSLENPDIIYVGDVDEIPDPKTLAKIKSNPGMLENKMYFLEQDMYYYHIECLGHKKWYQAALFPYQYYPQIRGDLNKTRRYDSFAPIIKYGGWHFSYFGGLETIRSKLDKFSHHLEFKNTKYVDPNYITDRINKCEDLFLNNKFSRTYVFDNSYLPSNYLQLCPNRPLTILYGTHPNYLDVTSKACELFLLGSTLIIPANYKFNNQFTDPCFNQIKKLVIMIGPDYVVINENNSHDLIINLEQKTVKTYISNHVNTTFLVIS